MSEFNFPNSTAVPFAMPNAPQGIVIDKVYLGNGPGTDRFGVAVASSNATPSLTDLRAIHSARVGKTGAKIVVVVVTGDRCVLFGPGADAQPFSLKTNVAKVFLSSVLDEPDLLSAYRRFSTTKRAVEVSETPWFTNHGLFASYHIRENAPKRKDWAELNQTYLPHTKKRGTELIKSLGFTSSKNEDQVLILSSTTDSSVVAILLHDDETFEGKSNRFQSSPVTWALKVAADRQIPWVVALKKGSIRLYPAKDGVGVGQRGQVETFFELDLELLDGTNAGYLGLVFSEIALRSGGSADNLISDSAKYSTSLGDRLRDRIYIDVVPDLAKAVAAAIIPEGEEKTPERLQEAYSVSLRILFRLLFQAYAEDRGLLPAGRNAAYDEYSLKSLAQTSQRSKNSFNLWEKLTRVWNAVESGDEEFGVPAYNGGLFNSSKSKSPEGHLIGTISLADESLFPVLRNLVIDSTEDEISGAVDFRSLSVREFGTIYEGLLESSLSVAVTDLTVDSDNLWVPAKDNQRVYVEKGSVYLHSNSGQRKSTGSYYTQSLLVDWLISRSLDPALDRHLGKVQNLIDEDEIAKAGKLFFDFRVADIAMGSGHFLVAAVDRIESRFRSFLVDQKAQLPRVEEELNGLAKAARLALGEDYSSFDSVDSSSLLRRQIARRCIYGLDLNPFAVELSRLAIWIHTFVPGLPMSSLDHNLTCGNSLTGIGEVSESLRLLQPEINTSDTFYAQTEIELLLEKSGELFRKVAETSESTKAHVLENASILQDAEDLIVPVRKAFDAALALRLGLTTARSAETEGQVDRILESEGVAAAINKLSPAHMPVLFPEVFARNNPGFDVLLGNPPWEKMVVKELEWWVKYVPGIKSDSYPKTVREEWLTDFRESHPNLVKEYEEDKALVESQRLAIARGPFEGIGSADVDLYTAFAWRNWQLLREHGYIGMVLPRNALGGAGLELWRRRVMDSGSFSDVAFLRNARQWAFQIDPRYTICLVVIAKERSEEVAYGGEYSSKEGLLAHETLRVKLPTKVLLQLSDSASFVLLGSQFEADLIEKFALSQKASVPLPGFSYRPYSDLHATKDRKDGNFYVGDKKDEKHIPALRGASFNIWDPSFGPPYGYSSREKLEQFFRSRLERANSISPFLGHNYSKTEYPIDHPRIAFRTTARNTDTRTSIVCLIPPETATVNMATVLFRRDGNAKTDAFLLGVMSSRIYDWVIRRWIDSTFSITLFNNMPLPGHALGTKIGDAAVQQSARLAAVDLRYTKWAEECGVEVGSVKTEEEKNELICELDALVALAYGLSAEDVTLIMKTFHVGWDYEPHLTKVLGYFEEWSK
jgi:hypothetical protein